MIKPIIFEISELSNRTDRIDTSYFNPIFFKTMKTLKKISKSKSVVVDDLSSFLNTKSETNLTGGATPDGAIYVNDGITFLRIQNIKENKIDFDSAVKIPITTHEEELSRSKLKPGDVLLTITGSYGISAVVPKEIDETNINQHIVKIEVNKSKILPEYLSLYLNSSICRNQMNRSATGSSRLALDYTAIKSLKIVCPCDLEKQIEIVTTINEIYLDIQKKFGQINKILNSFNDYLFKMLNLKFPTPKMNTFTIDPKKITDRIDAIYHNPHYQSVINSLNKSKFKPKPLKKFGVLEQEKLLPSDTPLEKFQLVELEDIDGELGLISNFKHLYGVKLNNSITKISSGQLIISRLRYYLKKIAIVDKKITNGISSNECYSFTCYNFVDLSYLHSILRSPIGIVQAESRVTGSSRPRNNKDDLENIQIPDASNSIKNEITARRNNDIQKIKKLQIDANSLTSHAKEKMDDFILNYQKFD